jgi:hypothetical protein
MRLKRPSAATIIAFTALFVVLGGSAYAAKQITSKDIKNGTIKTVDMSSSAKQALKGNAGPRGPQGVPGAQGAQGSQGPQGPAGPSEVSALTPVTGSLSVAAGTIDGGTVACPAGTRVVSGGFFADGGIVFLDAAGADRAGWAVAVDNSAGATAVTLTAEAYCAGAGKAVTAKAPSRKLKPLRGRFARMVKERVAH